MLLDRYDCTAFEMLLQGRQIREEQGGLPLGSALRATTKLDDRGRRSVFASEYPAEVGIGGDQYPAFLGGYFQQAGIPGFLEIPITDMDCVVSGVSER